MKKNVPIIYKYLAAIAVCILVSQFEGLVKAQPNKTEKANGMVMLRNTISDLKENYYDPAKLKEMNLDERVKIAHNMIDKAQSVLQIYGIIGQILIELNEPGTFFIPPVFIRMPDYGFNWSVVGDRCYVTYVRSGDDAEQKGLKPGDEILTIDEVEPNRLNAWKIKYKYFLGRPRPSLPIKIRTVNGLVKNLEIAMKFSNAQKGAVTESSFAKMITEIDGSLPNIDKSINGEVYVWRAGLSRGTSLNMSNVLSHKGVILDLRGCCLSEKSDLERIIKLMSNFTDKSVKIADIVSRDKSTSILVKSGGKNAYKGKIIAIVDSETKSVGEVIARTVQLEKLGIVIGDQTKGHVRLNTGFYSTIDVGFNVMQIYGAQITSSDVLMSDGQSLQNVGVIPDIKILPTATDIAAGHDPVIAKAVEMLGSKINYEDSGKLFTSRFTLWVW
jgi:C-terminal processing protease CtpA/Prc